MTGEYYMCPVCGKRWGETFAMGAELLITRCAEHVETLSAAEVVSKGMTAGSYDRMERLKKIRRSWHARYK